jgi:hypothetical protein
MCLSNMEIFTKNPNVHCPHCQGLGQSIYVRDTTEHGCDGSDEDCYNKCPVPSQEQYLDTCNVCKGTRFISYESLLVYVGFLENMSPLDKSELIEDCIEAAKEWTTPI